MCCVFQPGKVCGLEYGEILLEMSQHLTRKLYALHYETPTVNVQYITAFKKNVEQHLDDSIIVKIRV